ncbi:MAG: hypothetical protein JW795_20940 [Chitinivibrionales bacterium]|nr:hypothetical protein [Chitinivibrionales bacterium]
MKKTFLIALFFMLCEATQSAWSVEKTVLLQNGVEGYRGCVGTLIYFDGYKASRPLSNEMIFYYEQCTT